MIKPNRIAEILAQCKKDDMLMDEGEYNAYTDFYMSVAENMDNEKALVYVQSEIVRLKKTMDDMSTSYDEWQRARGGVTGLEKIKKAIKKYGE